jgi:hypothetical protein
MGPPRPGGGGGPAEEEKAAILEAILAFYDRFAEQNAHTSSPRLQLYAARAYRRVAELQSFRGNIDKASAEKAAVSFRRAADLLEGLLRAAPADASARGELAQTYLNAPPDVFADYDRKLVRARELAVGLDPPREHLAGSILLKLGWVRGRSGDAAGAERAYREAIDSLAPGAPDVRPPMAVAERAAARSSLAALLADGKRLADSRRVLEESLAELRSLGERSRAGRTPWELIAPTNAQLADVCQKLGDDRAAQAAREAAKQAQGQGGPGGFGGKKDGFGGKKDGGPPRKND